MKCQYCGKPIHVGDRVMQESVYDLKRNQIGPLYKYHDTRHIIAKKQAGWSQQRIAMRSKQ